MGKYTQESRQLALETPLGEDVLLVEKLEACEEISQLFSYKLELYSTEKEIAAKDIVGKNVTISLWLADESERYLNGYVSKFSYCGTDDRLSRYTAEVVPWLWFLTRTSDCRIFQERAVPDVIEQIFQDLGFQNYRLDLKKDHTTWEYCVQYRETDFNFVSRLMEKEGIFYFFQHERGKHELVLADHGNACRECPENLVWVAASASVKEPMDRITSWEHKFDYRPGKWAQTDYDFKKPSTSLMTGSSTLVELDGVDRYEVYDYPGKFVDRSVGEAEVKIRIEEEEAAHEIVVGASDCRTFHPGCKFKVRGHQSRTEDGKAYVVTSVRHTVSLGGTYVTGAAAGEPLYSNTFTCIPESRTFRPPRATPKPIVHGAQTAVVVGPDGEKIYPDEYGRVKVQFHWDREGKRNENSSCWIRVSQNWAGSGWGGMFIPHIGHEVIVDFLEGDPDRPIVTGRVYNAENMPPLNLPDNKHKSIIRDDYGNEMYFDATPGDEHIRIHSPHHWSNMTLGRSLVFTTDSDNKSLTSADCKLTTLGATEELRIGAKASQFLGVSSDVFVGASANAWVGASINFTAGVKYNLELGGSINHAASFKYTYAYSREISINKADYTKVSDDSIKLDSNDKIVLVGGPNDAGLVQIGKKDITLTLGEGSDSAIQEAETATKGKMIAATGAGVIAALAAAGTAALAGWSGHMGSEDEQAAEIGLGVAAGVVGVGALAAGGACVATTAAMMKKPKSKDYDSLHKKEFSTIKLEKDGLEIKHLVGGKKGKVADLQIQSNGTIVISNDESSGDIQLFSKGAIVLNSQENIEFVAPEVRATKGIFKSKNIVDLG